MSKFEQLLFWSAVALYGLSAFAYIFGLIARGEKLFTAGLVVAAAGFVPHTVSIGVRWTLGANPFISIAESLTLGTWVSLLLFLGLQLGTRKVRPLGVMLLPVVFVLMGWGGTLRSDPSSQIVPALQSPWLWVHIVGASTGFAAVLVAAGLGLMYLLKARQPAGGVGDRLPAPQVLDDLSYRFVVGGFTLYGLMIVSGAFWANQVKGNYWNWDPVEVWSLISWLIYGIYLHLRITFGWRGQRLAVYSLAAVVVMIVSYWGIPFGVETFHTGFRIEH
jgi:cytochrome c-type biogenesis protein CcsB